MIKQVHWKKRLAVALSGGLLVLNTAVVLAAPVELSLDDSIAIALKNNPAIMMAEADRKSAEFEYNVAMGGAQPSVSFSHSDGRSKFYSGVNPDIANSFSNSVTVRGYLYTGGKLEAMVEKTKLGLKVTDLSVDKNRQQIKMDATTSYFNVLQAVNVLKVSQESVDMMVAHLKNVQAQYGVGVVAKSDVLRSEVELANYQQKMIIAQNGYDLAVSKLNNVLGLSLDTEVKVKDELKHIKYESTLEDSIKYAMSHRPEAIQADYSIDVAKKEVEMNQADKLPMVVASATTGWSDKNFPGTENNTWSVGLSTTWNAFDSGVTDCRIKQADVAVSKAVQQAKQTKDRIQLEVRQAYLNMNEAEKRIAATQVAVDKAEEDFKIAGVRYSSGVGTNIDVIDAQVALTQAKNNCIQAMYDYNTSKASLDKAMGIAVANK